MHQATFLVDPFFPMLPVGLLFGWLFAKRWLPFRAETRFYLAMLAFGVFLSAFIGLAELPCYFDKMPPPPWTSLKTCNEFMWDGYVSWPLRSFGFSPPIPSYDAEWSEKWLVFAFGVQAIVGSTAMYAVFLMKTHGERIGD